MIIILIIIVALAIVLRLPSVKGFLGEYGVRRTLKKLPEEENIVLNDVMFPNQGKMKTT